MSWSAPVTGATPYQQPYQQQTYPNSHPGYGQQPHLQYGQQPAYGQYSQAPTFPAPGQPQRPPNIQPPKKKGNPIITRYPPPPGYRGPAQPQTPFGANQYPNQFQQPQPAVGQAPPAPFAYPPQAYNAPPTPAYSPQSYGPPQTPTYPQQPFAQAPNYQWPPQGYQPPNPYPQAPHQPGGQAYAPPASGYPGYPPPSAPVVPNQQSYSQAANWPQPNGQPHYPLNQQYPYNVPPHAPPQAYGPNATPTPTSAYPVAPQAPQVKSQPASVTESNFSGDKASLRLDLEDWDFDFEGAIWPKSNESVDPALSLGVIIWHPAKQVTRALPSTFDLAEEQSLKPTPEKLDNGESVSVYFAAENSHEAFLDVRQTSEWDRICDDPIFVVFTDDDMRSNMVSLEDCIGQRDRPDDHQPDHQNDDDEEMPDATWSVMDHLEQVLSRTNGGSSHPKPAQHTSVSAVGSSQEDILAKLGVTGAPKPPSDLPFPLPSQEHDNSSSVARSQNEAAVIPPPPEPQLPQQRGQSYGGNRENEYEMPSRIPYGSTSAGHTVAFPAPPPPPPPEPQRYNAWNQPQYNSQGYGGARGSPALSEDSNHTMAGSDFEPEKPRGGIENDKEASELPASLQRSDSSFSRKRSYEDADQGDNMPRQQDDHTKRKRRSQVDAAYSRR